MWGNCGAGWYFSWVVYKIGPQQNEKSFQQILTLKMVYQAHKVKLNWIWADIIQDFWYCFLNAISGNKLFKIKKSKMSESVTALHIKTKLSCLSVQTVSLQWVKPIRLMKLIQLI